MAKPVKKSGESTKDYRARVQAWKDGGGNNQAQSGGGEQRGGGGSNPNPGYNRYQQIMDELRQLQAWRR